MEQLTLLAHAKLNLSLDIVGRRADGYHLMQMVMQSVSLSDTLTLAKRREGITLACDDPALSCGEKNLAYKAAAAFFAETSVCGGVAVTLQKSIPSGAGLGGGSADAAAVLIGLDRLYQTGLPLHRLIAIGALIGADVPFCLCGGTALVEGIGEVISPLPPLPECHFVIVKPEQSVNTAAAFSAFDRQPPLRRPDTAGMLAAIRQGSLPEISRLLCNVFEDTAELPELARIQAALRQAGARNALMTGSGSAVFGLFTEAEPAKAYCAVLQKAGASAFLCPPVRQGVTIV